MAVPCSANNIIKLNHSCISTYPLIEENCKTKKFSLRVPCFLIGFIRMLKFRIHGLHFYQYYLFHVHGIYAFDICLSSIRILFTEVMFLPIYLYVCVCVCVCSDGLINSSLLAMWVILMTHASLNFNQWLIISGFH